MSALLACGAVFAGTPQTKKPAPGKAAQKPAAQKPAAQPAALSPAAQAGKKVYDNQGCANCHAIGGKGGSAGPDLTRTGADATHTAAWMQVQVLTPTKHKPDSTMPAFNGKIKPADMTTLAAYLVSLKGGATAGGGTSTPTAGYKELGQLRAWAYTSKQAPTEDHVNIEVFNEAGKKTCGQVLVNVEQPAKMFYAVNLPAGSKKSPLPGLPADAAAGPPSSFVVVFTGGKAVVDVDGKFNPGDGKVKPAHMKIELYGIGTVSSVGNPLGEMKVGFTITDPATKAVLWKNDVKKVVNGYVHVYAPDAG